MTTKSDKETPANENGLSAEDLFLDMAEAPDIRVMGVTARISNAENAAAESINRLWQEFAASNLVETDRGWADTETFYAVYHDYEGDHTKPFSVTIGYALKDRDEPQDMSKELHTVLIPASSYARLIVRGPQPQGLMQGWAQIWSSDMPRRFDVDFERYGKRFFDPVLQEVEIFVGLEERPS